MLNIYCIKDTLGDTLEQVFMAKNDNVAKRNIADIVNDKNFNMVKKLADLHMFYIGRIEEDSTTIIDTKSYCVCCLRELYENDIKGDING